MPPSPSGSPCSTHETPAVGVDVDLARVVTGRFLGVGVQCSAYPWWDLTDDEWERVFRRLEFMQPPLMRVMQSAFYYWTGHDSSGDPVYDFESIYQQKLRKVLDWCERHAVQVMLGEWGCPLGVDGHRITNDDQRWTAMIGDFLADLFERRDYQCVTSYNLVNEPHGDWSTIAGRFDVWKRAILNLRSEFERRGLTDRLPIAAPDADDEWLIKTLEDNELVEASGVMDIHWYVTRQQLSDGAVERNCSALCKQIEQATPGRPLVFGELGVLDGKTPDDRQPNVYHFGYGVDMADAAVQLLRAGAAGFIAWYLDDAMHFLGDGEYVRREGDSLPDDAYERRKVWGMWNSLGDRMGSPQDSQLRPWFFTWALLSRCFPAGAQILATEIGDDTCLTAVGAKFLEQGRAGLSLAIVNRAAEPRVIEARFSGVHHRVNLWRYDYYDLDGDDRPDAWPSTVDANGDDLFPRPVGHIDGVDLHRGVRIDLPGRGVTFLTSSSGGSYDLRVENGRDAAKTTHV